MASNLLNDGDYNVITVHWGDGASGDYITSACNIRLVGLEIALLVNTLIVSAASAIWSIIHLNIIEN